MPLLRPVGVRTVPHPWPLPQRDMPITRELSVVCAVRGRVTNPPLRDAHFSAPVMRWPGLSVAVGVPDRGNCGITGPSYIKEEG